MEEKKKLSEQIKYAIKAAIISYIASVAVTKIMDVIFAKVNQKLEAKKQNQLTGGNENEEC